MNDYWMEWFVGTAKNDSYSEDYAEMSCAGTSYSLPASPVDLWLGECNGSACKEGPARGLNGTGVRGGTAVGGCSVGQNNTCEAEVDCMPYPGWPNTQHAGCNYEDALFTGFIKDAILQHDPTSARGDEQGLFIFWAPHVIHTPLEVPQSYLEKFAHITDWRRRRYVAMVNYLDDSVGAVVDALKQRGLYERTVITFSSDNGGPIYGEWESSACITLCAPPL